MKYASATLLAFILISCQSTKMDLGSINAEKWKEDKNGCTEYRAQNIDDLYQSKAVFLKLSEVEIMEVLGQPDKAELIERSEKIYIYMLEAGRSCKVEMGDKKSIKIFQLRFNSMGYCNSALIVNMEA